MKINIIAAISENRGLGKDNELLFRIPEDLKRFKELTTGHPVIMGRKTYESIGKPLPNRTNIIITRDPSFNCHPEFISGSRNKFGMTECLVTNSLEEAIEIAKNVILSASEESHEILRRTSFTQDDIKQNEEIFIIGGGQIYQQAIDIADKLYLTIVKDKYEADTFFPDYSAFKKVIFKEKHKNDKYEYTFIVLEK